MSFRPPFPKGGADPTRGALVAARTRRNILILPKRHRGVNAEPWLGRGEPHKWGVPLFKENGRRGFAKAKYVPLLHEAFSNRLPAFFL